MPSAINAVSSRAVGECQANGKRQCSGNGADQREIEHDGRGRFGLGEPAGLDHGAGVAEGRGDRKQRAHCCGRAGRPGIGPHVKMRNEHHDHAGKADHHGGPPVNAHALLQDDGSKRNSNERRRKRDRGRIGERQAGERRKIREHAANTERAAAELPQRTAGAHGGGELAAQRIDHQYGQNREGAAKEHHLADRRDVAQLSYQAPTCRQTAARKSASVRWL